MSGAGNGAGNGTGKGTGRRPPSESELEAVYQERILEHWRRPRNKGELPDARASGAASNPLCGDEITVQLALDDDRGEARIRAAAFTGRGCSISQASASMMTGALAGKSRAEAEALDVRVRAMLAGDAGAAADETLGELRALAAVARFPARVQCALMAWDALERSLSGDR